MSETSLYLKVFLFQHSEKPYKYAIFCNKTRILFIVTILMMIGRKLIQRITIFASSGIKMITQGHRDFWEFCFWENRKCEEMQ